MKTHPTKDASVMLPVIIRITKTSLNFFFTAFLCRNSRSGYFESFLKQVNSIIARVLASITPMRPYMRYAQFQNCTMQIYDGRAQNLLFLIVNYAKSYPACCRQARTYCTFGAHNLIRIVFYFYSVPVSCHSHCEI